LKAECPQVPENSVHQKQTALFDLQLVKVMLTISWDNEVRIYSDNKRALLNSPPIHCISIVRLRSNISAGFKEIAAYWFVMKIRAWGCTKARISFALFVLSIVWL